MKRVVICMSGGFDSSVLAALNRSKVDLWPLHFQYGQPPEREEYAALRRVVESLSLKEPEVHRLPSIAMADDPSAPYYPYRNLIFATLAAAYAERVGAAEVWFGFVADANTRLFPDASPEFAATCTSFLAHAYGALSSLKIEAPVGQLRKADLVKAAAEIGFDPSPTYSCYRGGGRCLACNACRAIAGAFSLAVAESPSDAARLGQLDPNKKTFVGV